MYEYCYYFSTNDKNNINFYINYTYLSLIYFLFAQFFIEIHLVYNHINLVYFERLLNVFIYIKIENFQTLVKAKNIE